jgi:hypothetical protein
MQANSILFIDTVNELLVAMDKAERVIKGIMDSPDLSKVVAEVSDTNNRVTVLEPAILNLRMKQITGICANMVLIGYVQEKDPKRELVDSEGNSWYELAKAPQLTVKAVKATREALDYRRIDIRDAKTIVELVRDGLL